MCNIIIRTIYMKLAKSTSYMTMLSPNSIIVACLSLYA